MREDSPIYWKNNRVEMRTAGFDPDRAAATNPIATIGSAWTNAHRCNNRVRANSDLLVDLIAERGRQGLVVGAPAASDALTQSTPTAGHSLVLRDVVADCFEIGHRARHGEAMIVISGCDKTGAAALTPLARTDAVVPRATPARCLASAQLLSLLLLALPPMSSAAADPPAAPPPASAVTTAATVTGSVVMRERLALRPGFALTVKLLDVSRADAPAVVVAEQVIPLGTRQLPVSFELTYDPARIEANHRYAVQARIEFQGQLAFITDQQYPVLTRGAPAHVDLVVKRVPKKDRH